MSTLHLIAPSGYCLQQDAATRGVARLESAGHQVNNIDVIARRFQRFAGTDAERLADINRLAHIPAGTDIALAVRGGYGLSRLLQDIDYTAIAARLAATPLCICGHSDFTAFQLALLAQTGAITFSGPMLAGNFGTEDLNTFTWNHFWQALRSPIYTLDWHSDGPDCDTDGTLWGGNLAMLCSLVGSPWLPAISGGILVLEDINEHPFRVERMLLQLANAGILARQNAIVLGSFNGASVSDYDAGYGFTAMCDYLRERLPIPLITGLPFGHEPQTVTLPLGAHATLRNCDRHATLTLSGHPVV